MKNDFDLQIENIKNALANLSLDKTIIITFKEEIGLSTPWNISCASSKFISNGKTSEEACEKLIDIIRNYIKENIEKSERSVKNYKKVLSNTYISQ